MSTKNTSDPADVSHLWDAISTHLSQNGPDDWMLIPFINNSNSAAFIQAGWDGINMRCIFSPRDEAGPGMGVVKYAIDAGTMPLLIEFIQANPGAMIAENNERLLFWDGDGTCFEAKTSNPKDWEHAVWLGCYSNVVSPCGPDLYGRISAWYVDCLKAILTFMRSAGAWHRDRRREKADQAAAGHLTNTVAQEAPRRLKKLRASMRTMPRIAITNNHLTVLLSTGHWLIDTGAQLSFGDSLVVTEHAQHAVPESCPLLGLSQLREYTGIRRLSGLIGCDILNQYDVHFDLAGETMKFEKTAAHQPAGNRVDLKLLGGAIPTLDVNVGGSGMVRMIFDTGAQHSYIDELTPIDTRHIGQAEDFHVSCGRFKVDLHEATVTLGSVTGPVVFATEPGKLISPPHIRNLLKSAGVQGILGWEILKHGPMAYLPRRNELWI